MNNSPPSIQVQVALILYQLNELCGMHVHKTSGQNARSARGRHMKGTSPTYLLPKPVEETDCMDP